MLTTAPAVTIPEGAGGTGVEAGGAGVAAGGEGGTGVEAEVTISQLL